MAPAQTKFLIAGVVVAAAIGFLLYMGVIKGKAVYLEVDDYVVDQQAQGKRVRLRGTVDKANIEIADTGRAARFKLAGEAQMISVAYEGTIPDMFRPGAQVVVAGKLDEQGVFQADELLTKCASKYTEGEPAHGPQGPGGAN